MKSEKKTMGDKVNNYAEVFISFILYLIDNHQKIVLFTFSYFSSINNLKLRQLLTIQKTKTFFKYHCVQWRQQKIRSSKILGYENGQVICSLLALLSIFVTEFEPSTWEPRNIYFTARFLIQFECSEFNNFLSLNALDNKNILYFMMLHVYCKSSVLQMYELL